MDTAKKIIMDAVLGLIVALGAYFLLFTINPDLVNINISLTPVSDFYYSTTYTGKQYPQLPAATTNMPSGCSKTEWQTIFSNAASSTGVDKCAIQAVAAMESSCTQIPSRTEGGRDCSAFQIDANGNCKTSCEDLEANPQKAAICAAEFLKKCSSGWRNNPTEQQIRDMYAGYNGGCGALAASTSCAGTTNEYGNPFKKWDCKINCGGYCPVPTRTSRFLSYYNQCKAN